MASLKTTFLYKQGVFHFHVSESECIALCTKRSIRSHEIYPYTEHVVPKRNEGMTGPDWLAPTPSTPSKRFGTTGGLGYRYARTT